MQPEGSGLGEEVTGGRGQRSQAESSVPSTEEEREEGGGGCDPLSSLLLSLREKIKEKKTS